MSNDFMFIERCRIWAARELQVPPDNIDMQTIFTCVKSAIINKCESEKDIYYISILSKQESEAFLSYGSDIIDAIFTQEEPFGDWAEQFEYDYMNELSGDV